LGIGTIRLNLKSDDGAINVITIWDAVYIPTSPFNLLQPQLLVRKLNDLQYECDMAIHSNTQYVFRYSKNEGQMLVQCQLTSPLDPMISLPLGQAMVTPLPFTRSQQMLPNGVCLLAMLMSYQTMTTTATRESRHTKKPKKQGGGSSNQENEGPPSLSLEKTREHANAVPYKDKDFQPIVGRDLQRLF
jgi:hypothetical protein